MNTPDRVRRAASRLFAERGYGGTSVRAICAAAGANVNAVSYHFGGKKALYVGLLRGMGDERFASAQRILGAPAATLTEVRVRLLLFVEETLAALLTEPELLSILVAESQQAFRIAGPESVAGLEKQSAVLITFLRDAQEAGHLRPGVDIDIIAGTIVERVNNQVIHRSLIAGSYGRSADDPAHRRHWAEQTVDLLLFGAAAQGAR
jgi:AcrR family transcriptional regulator